MAPGTRAPRAAHLIVVLYGLFGCGARSQQQSNGDRVTDAFAGPESVSSDGKTHF